MPLYSFIVRLSYVNSTLWQSCNAFTEMHIVKKLPWNDFITGTDSLFSQNMYKKRGSGLPRHQISPAFLSSMSGIAILLATVLVGNMASLATSCPCAPGINATQELTTDSGETVDKEPIYHIFPSVESGNCRDRNKTGSCLPKYKFACNYAVYAWFAQDCQHLCGECPGGEGKL